MGETLNETMAFDHVIRVDERGGVSEPSWVREPGGAYVHTEGAEPELEQRPGDGWSMLSGWTGQYSYNGPVMHNSEFIGGGLAEHIRQNPGYYVALTVSYVGTGETNCEKCGAESGEWCTDDCEGDRETLIEGWVVAFRELEEDITCLLPDCGLPAREHVSAVAAELRDHFTAAEFYGTCPGDIGVHHRLYPEAFPTPGPYSFVDCDFAELPDDEECWHVNDPNGNPLNEDEGLSSELEAREWAAQYEPDEI